MCFGSGRGHESGGELDAQDYGRRSMQMQDSLPHPLPSDFQQHDLRDHAGAECNDECMLRVRGAGRR